MSSFIRFTNAFDKIIFVKACEICVIEQVYPADTKLIMCSGNEVHVKQSPSEVIHTIESAEKEPKEKEDNYAIP